MAHYAEKVHFEANYNLPKPYFIYINSLAPGRFEWNFK